MQQSAGPQQLRRLLDGVLTVGSELELPIVLETITATAAELVDAQYGALGVLDSSGTGLAEFITVGISAGDRARIGALPEGHGILGVLIVDPRPLRLPDLRQHPASFGFPPNHPPMRSFLGVPIVVRGEVFGNLYLCDKRDGDAFTDVDEEMAVGLAAAAGVAIENARLHAKVAALATLEDRERIARDLHDTVIQRLFAIGLGLQGTLKLVSDSKIESRLLTAIDDLDTTVREVRAAIFELHTARLPGRSVRQELVRLCAESARGLGFDPVIRFDGPIDSAVDDALADDLFAAAREGLSNISRHAAATTSQVSVSARGGILLLRITDNGTAWRGDRIGAAGRGIDNLSARAARRHGHCRLARIDDTTTVLSWEVPLTAEVSDPATAPAR